MAEVLAAFSQQVVDSLERLGAGLVQGLKLSKDKSCCEVSLKM